MLQTDLKYQIWQFPTSSSGHSCSLLVINDVSVLSLTSCALETWPMHASVNESVNVSVHVLLHASIGACMHTYIWCIGVFDSVQACTDTLSISHLTVEVSLKTQVRQSFDCGVIAENQVKSISSWQAFYLQTIYYYLLLSTIDYLQLSDVERKSTDSRMSRVRWKNTSRLSEIISLQYTMC